MINIARSAFSGYFGHYHSDPRLDKRDCDEAYVSWCENTARNIGDTNKIIIVQDTAGICGFLTMKVHDDKRLELVLSGVAKRVEGRGVYRRMIQKGVQYALEAGFKRVFTSTQIINLAVQRVWIAQGFFPVKFEIRSTSGFNPISTHFRQLKQVMADLSTRYKGNCTLSIRPKQMKKYNCGILICQPTRLWTSVGPFGSKFVWQEIPVLNSMLGTFFHPKGICAKL